MVSAFPKALIAGSRGFIGKAFASKVKDHVQLPPCEGWSVQNLENEVSRAGATHLVSLINYYPPRGGFDSLKASRLLIEVPLECARVAARHDMHFVSVGSWFQAYDQGAPCKPSRYGEVRNETWKKVSSLCRASQILLPDVSGLLDPRPRLLPYLLKCREEGCEPILREPDRLIFPLDVHDCVHALRTSLLSVSEGETYQMPSAPSMTVSQLAKFIAGSNSVVVQGHSTFSPFIQVLPLGWSASFDIFNWR